MSFNRGNAQMFRHGLFALLVMFMAVGAIAPFFPDLRNVFMGLGFGGLHLIFGWIIRRRHGG